MFLILTQPSLVDAAADLFEEELKQNIAAAMTTAKCLAGMASPSEFDTSMNFNVEVWKNRSFIVLGYAAIMLEALDNRWPNSTPFGTASLREDIGEILLGLMLEDDEQMSLPLWVERPECLNAMRSHLIYKNAVYRQLWPELPPFTMPVPEGAGLRAYA